MTGKLPARHQKQFTDDVLSLLSAHCVDARGNTFQGQSYSFLRSELRCKGWRNLEDLDLLLAEAGFTIVEGAKIQSGVRFYGARQIVTV